MCCHCLLIESEDGLILVDTGIGVEDVADARRLGFMFCVATRPRLEVSETALRQVARSHRGEVKLMCSHDPTELAAFRN
jgi:hypothetical protein